MFPCNYSHVTALFLPFRSPLTVQYEGSNPCPVIKKSLWDFTIILGPVETYSGFPRQLLPRDSAAVVL